MLGSETLISPGTPSAQSAEVLPLPAPDGSRGRRIELFPQRFVRFLGFRAYCIAVPAQKGFEGFGFRGLGFKGLGIGPLGSKKRA